MYVIILFSNGRKTLTRNAVITGDKNNFTILIKYTSRGVDGIRRVQLMSA